VRSYEGDGLAERGGRPRRFYELTAEGTRAAKSQRRTILRVLQPVGAW
jgi:PadR family transcriptional regulator PadR